MSKLGKSRGVLGRRYESNIEWGEYKAKFVCFACRKMFKPYSRRIRGKGQESGWTKSPKCPQCGGTIVYPGMFFKPPKQNDVEAWQVAEELCRNGILYHGRWWEDPPGYRPRTKRELNDFLKQKKADSDGPLLKDPT